jgi:hypothetical protein
MYKVYVAAITLGLATASCTENGSGSITQSELVRRTQELLDGVTAGDRKPFERYFADDALDHDEKGRTMDKKALLADITPPPPHWSGSLKLSHPESRIVGNTAVLSYDLDETETISGQTVQARYHTTDIWLRRAGNWQIIAEQALRYYADPIPGNPDPTTYGDYRGMYELEPGKTREVTSQGESLFMQRPGKDKELLLTEAGDIFFRKDVEGRIVFRRNAHGKVDALIDRRNNEDIVWQKTR